MFSGRIASRCLLNPTTKNGGKVDVNGRAQASPTKDRKLVICGIDAARTSATIQYNGAKMIPMSLPLLLLG